MQENAGQRETDSISRNWAPLFKGHLLQKAAKRLKT